MSFTIVDTLPEETWASYVCEHPNGNIFLTPEMFQVFARTKGHRPRLHAALDEQGKVRALVTPVMVSLYHPIARLFTTRSIAYGGALYDQNETGIAALGALLRTSAQRARPWALFTELRNQYDMTPAQETLAACGYAYEEHLNYLVDIGLPSDQIMQNITSHMRRNIRGAIKKGSVSVEDVSTPAQMDTWYEIIRKSYLNARVPLADRSLFQAAYDILVPKGMARFYLARTSQAYVAANVELTYKGVVYGWYHGIDRDVNGEHAGELLMWEILKWGSENGYKVYDWGGAGRPSEPSGVRTFKAKFGGQLVCYGRNTCVHAPLRLEVSKRVYEMQRKRAEKAQGPRPAEKEEEE